MSDQVAVVTDALRAHASQLEGFQSQADVAADAARQVSFTPDMYGRYGQLLVYPFIAPLEIAGVTATSSVGAALGVTADAVRGMAASFDFVDDAVGSAIDGIRGVI